MTTISDLNTSVLHKTRINVVVLLFIPQVRSEAGTDTLFLFSVFLVIDPVSLSPFPDPWHSIQLFTFLTEKTKTSTYTVK